MVNLNRLASIRLPEEASRDAAEKLVAEIQEARKEIIAQIDQLYRMSAELRTISRREPHSQAYVAFANAHLRLAGALNQGIRRTRSTDRLLKIGQAEREETRRQEERAHQRKRAKEQQKAVDKLVLTTDDDFDEIYGEVTSRGLIDA
jgi:hypothetical protein